jgi:hypothetical protein
VKVDFRAFSSEFLVLSQISTEKVHREEKLQRIFGKIKELTIVRFFIEFILAQAEKSLG